jgi:hypothetical protein
MPRPLYRRGKSSRYPLDRRLSGPQNWSEQGGEEEGPFIDPARIWTPIVQAVAQSYTDWAAPEPYPCISF